MSLLQERGFTLSIECSQQMAGMLQASTHQTKLAVYSSQHELKCSTHVPLADDGRHDAWVGRRKLDQGVLHHGHVHAVPLTLSVSARAICLRRGVRRLNR